jgi:pimeloyl-ACP methyl ester carboxylesterase
MQNFRIYGEPPFTIAVIHGGPGAIGEMEPVACHLALEFGVLEPLQTATTLSGQVEELKTILQENGDQPVVLIGFSWGAWLSYIVTARYQTLVKKLILVGSGPFEHHYVDRITETRMSRLTQDEQIEYHSIIQLLGKPNAVGKAENFARLGQLATKTDYFDPIEVENTKPESDKSSSGAGNPFHAVLKEAQGMRKSGVLLSLADQIQCPVVALHGDFDPHPAEGVREPLSGKLEDFCFIMLEKCGHKPWIERQAQEDFFTILRGELRAT